MNHTEEARYVFLDPEKLKRARINKGLAQKQIPHLGGPSPNTVAKAFRGEGIFPSSAKKIADCLGTTVTDLLADKEPKSDASDQQSAGEQELIAGEWQIDDYLGGWVTTSNVLQFCVCRMQSAHIEGRLGRGKCYDLVRMADRDRENLQEQLVRHPTVSSRIGKHPNIALHLNTTPGPKKDVWWVIDEWIDGSSLAERLQSEPFPPAQLPDLMRGIAAGIEALHRAEIVFRELAPSRVIVRSDSGEAVLTDFELAKLLGDAPTVSKDWPDDPYRAPEVESGRADKRADLYSWARILVRAATGSLPAAGADTKALDKAELPKSVQKIATACLSPGPSDRPKSIEQLAQALRKW